MHKHRMFKLVRELVKEVPGLEKWSLKQLENPNDPTSTKISPIKVAVMSKIFGEFQLGNTILALSQEHRFGQPPQQIAFSLPNVGVVGNAIIFGINNGKMALLVGDLGCSESKAYQLPSPIGSPEAVIEWIEKLSNNIYWEA